MPLDTHTVLRLETEQIEKAKKDISFFEPLYKKYYLQIYKFIYTRTGDEPIAKDITSIVFTKAIEKINTYISKGFPFSSWLYRIARNEIAGFYRAQKKEHITVISPREFNNLKEEVTDHQNKDLSEKLIALLNTLQRDEIELIELKYFEQRPFKEVAEIVGLSESNVRVKTHRIIQKLKKLS